MNNILKIILFSGIAYVLLQSCSTGNSNNNAYSSPYSLPQEEYNAPQYDESKGGIVADEPEYVGTTDEQNQRLSEEKRNAAEERERNMERLKQQNEQARQEAAIKAQESRQYNSNSLSTPTPNSTNPHTSSYPDGDYSPNSTTQAYEAMEELIKKPQYHKKNGNVDRMKVKNALNDMGYRQANGKKFNMSDIPKYY